MSDLPILPTTVVGSHGKPGWWHVCKDLSAQGAWGPYDLEELLRDAVDIAILDQERAGVDIITDGEARRLDGYVDGYYRGVSHLLHTRRPSHLRALLYKLGNVEGEVLHRLIYLNVMLPSCGRPDAVVIFLKLTQ